VLGDHRPLAAFNIKDYADIAGMKGSKLSSEDAHRGMSRGRTRMSRETNHRDARAPETQDAIVAPVNNL
jgi:hypothetical protein